MEKLIMLIDIYEEEVVGVHSVGDKITDKEELRIVSKKFGFIERLVKTNKIDLEGIEQRAIEFFYDESPVRGKEIRAERLIMMLSVQYNPIDFLISYLR